MRAHSDGFVTIHGKQSTLILELVATGAPIWRYWGVKLPRDCAPPCPLSDSLGIPTFSLDQNVPFTLFPTFGAGWYGAPAFLAHRAGRNSLGKDFTQDFTSSNWAWDRRDEAVTFTLLDQISNIEVCISLDLDPTNDVLSCKTSLTNRGTTDLSVQWLASASLPLPADAQKVISFTGRHNHEFEEIEDNLSRATWLRENRRGLTSHDCVPGALVALAGTTEHNGHAYGAQLAWSGNHCQRIDPLDDGGYQWQLGAWLAPGEIQLGPRETLRACDVLATFSPHGLNGVAQNFHAGVRARMTWPSGSMKPRPVHLNTWEGVYFDLNEATLKHMAEEAAAIGVERFVLDDGWFQGRSSDKSGLGDWWVDTDIFPNGLGQLANHVTGLGMEFGLWVEPEMVNPDSALYRAHPDWALQIEGRAQLTARNQLVLDLCKPEVFDYLLDHLGTLLETLPISYLKWDHNRDVTLAGSDGAPAYRGQVLASYRLFDAIRAAWPNVEIEACAGGGGRIDAGILQRTHRVWTSDCIDAVSRVAIQRGFLRFFPPEVMGCHIGASPAHSTGRRQAMNFRANVAFGGHFGIELDPRHLNAQDRKQVAFWIRAYKDHRHILHSGKLWQGEAGEGATWQAQGQPDDFILSVFRVAPSGRRHPPKLILPFVDQARAYKLTLISPSSQEQDNAVTLLAHLNSSRGNVSGAWLANSGLLLPPMKGEDGLIIRLTAS